MIRSGQESSSIMDIMYAFHKQNADVCICYGLSIDPSFVQAFMRDRWISFRSVFSENKHECNNSGL